MSKEVKRCKDCDHFHIRQEPLPHHYDAGLAECKKHNLVVDFFNHGKLNKLKCVEGSSMSGEMSREQAIQIVSEIRDIDGFPLDDKKALNMAIAALSAEPCGDCISREAARDLMYQRQEPLNEYMLDSLPSVQPIRPRGHWERISIDKYVQHSMAVYRCSECGGDIIGKHNYCPSCGCDMRESNDV